MTFVKSTVSIDTTSGTVLSSSTTVKSKISIGVTTTEAMTGTFSKGFGVVHRYAHLN